MFKYMDVCSKVAGLMTALLKLVTAVLELL